MCDIDCTMKIMVAKFKKVTITDFIVPLLHNGAKDVDRVLAFVICIEGEMSSVDKMAVEDEVASALSSCLVFFRSIRAFLIPNYLEESDYEDLAKLVDASSPTDKSCEPAVARAIEHCDYYKDRKQMLIRIREFMLNDAPTLVDHESALQSLLTRHTAAAAGGTDSTGPSPMDDGEHHHELDCGGDLSLCLNRVSVMLSEIMAFENNTGTMEYTKTVRAVANDVGTMLSTMILGRVDAGWNDTSGTQTIASFFEQLSSCFPEDGSFDDVLLDIQAIHRDQALKKNRSAVTDVCRKIMDRDDVEVGDYEDYKKKMMATAQFAEVDGSPDKENAERCAEHLMESLAIKLPSEDEGLNERVTQYNSSVIFPQESLARMPYRMDLKNRGCFLKAMFNLVEAVRPVKDSIEGDTTAVVTQLQACIDLVENLKLTAYKITNPDEKSRFFLLTMSKGRLAAIENDALDKANTTLLFAQKRLSDALNAVNNEKSWDDGFTAKTKFVDIRSRYANTFGKIDMNAIKTYAATLEQALQHSKDVASKFGSAVATPTEDTVNGFLKTAHVVGATAELIADMQKTSSKADIEKHCRAVVKPLRGRFDASEKDLPVALQRAIQQGIDFKKIA